VGLWLGARAAREERQSAVLGDVGLRQRAGNHPEKKADGRCAVGFSLRLPAQDSGAIAMSLSLHRSG
jgi:hypothetical protein